MGIQWSQLYLPAVLFLLLALLQFSLGLTLDRAGTREAVVKLAMVLLFLLLGGQLFASPPALRRLALGTAVFASLLGLFAVLQFFSSEGLIYWMVRPRAGWVFGPYVNHNHYAGLMEMLIPIGIAYVLSLRRDLPARYLLGFGLLIALASVLLSGSRGGTLALLAEALIFAAMLFWWSVSRVPAAAFGTASLLAILLFLWMDTGEISKRLATLVANTSTENYGDRGIAARDALGMFRANAWVGTGLGSFETAFPRYRSLASDLTWNYAHNDYAQALAETGIPGGLLMAWALVLFVRSAFKNLRVRLDQPAELIRFGAVVGICGLLIHSFVDFNLHIPANAAWFAFCGGVSVLNDGR